MKEHLALQNDDALTHEEIPAPPAWLEEQRPKKSPRREKHSRFPGWAGVLAGALATFIFMVSSPGQAVSEFIHDFYIGWNEDQSKFDFSYNKNSPDETYLKLVEDFNTSRKFTSLEDLQERYPELHFLINDDYPLEQATVTGDLPNILVGYYYNIDGKYFLVSQTIFFTKTAMSGSIEIDGDAVPVDCYFNNGSIHASGGYEPSSGYGNAMAFYENYEFSFLCDGLPLETYTDFIEGCYLD